MKNHLLHNSNGHPAQYLSSSLLPQFSNLAQEGFEINPRWIFSVIRRRALIIVGVTAIVASAVFATAINKAPNYQGSFRLLIESVQTRDELLPLLTEAIRASAQIPGNSSNLDYDSQIQVLMSRQVLTPIVEQLQATYPEITYGSLSSQLEIIRGDGSKNSKTSKILQVSYSDPNPQKVEFVLETIVKSFLDYSFQNQRTKLKQGAQFVNEQIPKLQQQVNQLQDQSLRLAKEYRLLNPEGQSQQLAAQISQISGQRFELQTQLKQLQTQYSAIQNQLNLGQDKAVIASALSEDAQYQQLQRQLQELDTRIAIATTQFSSDHPSLQSLREQRQSLLPLVAQKETQILGSKGLQGEISPTNLASQTSIDKTLTAQLVNIDIDIKALESRYANLIQEERKLLQQAKDLPDILRRYNELQLQLDISTDNLKNLLVKQKALQLEAAEETIPWQLIDAVTVKSLDNDINNSLGLGVLSGLILGTVIALTLEKFNDVFYSPEDLEENIHLPLLGAVPVLKESRATNYFANVLQLNYSRTLSKNSGELQLPNDSNFIASFRSLYANISFLSPETQVSSIAVLSALPQEGKSTIATHLAITAAELGHRVLLVDANLRSPTIHELFGLPNVSGLSEAITHDLETDYIIQRATLTENLFVITSGYAPNDSTKLLSSRKMEKLMEQFKATFDLVIYDTSSMNNLTDASFVASRTDGAIIVVRLESVNRLTLTKALNNLKFSGIRILGTISNKIK